MNTAMNPKDRVPLPDPLSRFYAAFDRMQKEDEERRSIERKKLEHYTRLQIAPTQLLERFGAQFQAFAERIELLEKREGVPAQPPDAKIIERLNAVTAETNRISRELPVIREEVGRISNDFSSVCDALERGGMH